MAVESKTNGKAAGSGVLVIALAIIWASVILTSAVILLGTPYWPQLLPILGGGAASSIILTGAVTLRRS